MTVSGVISNAEVFDCESFEIVELVISGRRWTPYSTPATYLAMPARHTPLTYSRCKRSGEGSTEDRVRLYHAT